ncbi:DUF4350 domain-containing protein [Deltaproteobacteria bacterium]|nr:DUF4350 domain-containing protein [Deltaproteobacteria bacterium]
MSEEKQGIRLETWLAVGLVVSILLSTSLILFASSDKQTVYSAYVGNEADGDYQYQQLGLMRDSLGKYTIANTMSTPMLVNDWREPHRTTLVIVAPEKPFDQAEAEAIHDFVTNKGGKVILAADSSNAQQVADQFGVQFFESPIMDMRHYYEVNHYNGPMAGTQAPQNEQNVWTVASINQDVAEMNPLAMATGCSSKDLLNHSTDNCRMPVLMRSPTAIQVLGPGIGEDEDINRDVKVLATASNEAYADRTGTGDLSSGLNIQLGAGQTGLIIRIDYPGIEAMDAIPGGGPEQAYKISVTGSIVFVSNDDAFADHLWDQATAKNTGKDQCQAMVYVNHTCWNSELSNGESTWRGNGAYFAELIHDMSEQENDELSALIKLHPEKFYVVFDESRHVSSTLTAPFTEAMGAIVLLTSDAWLKWLIVLNLLALLSIAIMVVPEKENWRHVFDLTRFRERPEKIDPNKYQLRVRQALMEKVRIFHDLTKDQMAVKAPAEVQALIRDPRLVELAYSQNRIFTPDELRQHLQAIRRWGK